MGMRFKAPEGALRSNLALFLRPLPVPAAELPPGPAVQIIPPPEERAEPEPETLVESPAEVHVIESCTVTWYTEDTCGKAPDHPAYGITASGLPVYWTGPEE